MSSSQAEEFLDLSNNTEDVETRLEREARDVRHDNHVHQSHDDDKLGRGHGQVAVDRGAHSEGRHFGSD